jgi:hypothetical protein
VRLLGTLIATLDNAEAVPVEGVQKNLLPRRLGDPSGEVPRRELDQAAVAALLATETQSRLVSAGDYDRHDRADGAAGLRNEAELIARFAAPRAPAAPAPPNRP